jgi:hypothetical protein
MIENIWPNVRDVIDYHKIMNDSNKDNTRTVSDGFIHAGDYVMLSLKKKNTKKMALRYLGPLKVAKEDGKDSKFILQDRNRITMAEVPMNRLKKIFIANEDLLFDSKDPLAVDDLLSLRVDGVSDEVQNDKDFVPDLEVEKISDFEPPEEEVRKRKRKPSRKKRKKRKD